MENDKNIINLYNENYLRKEYTINDGVLYINKKNCFDYRTPNFYFINGDNSSNKNLMIDKLEISPNAMLSNITGFDGVNTINNMNISNMHLININGFKDLKFIDTLLFVYKEYYRFIPQSFPGFDKVLFVNIGIDKDDYFRGDKIFDILTKQLSTNKDKYNYDTIIQLIKNFSRYETFPYLVHILEECGYINKGSTDYNEVINMVMNNYDPDTIKQNNKIISEVFGD